MKSGEEFERILQDIKDVKIQGAEAIASAGLKAYLIKPEKSSVKKILATRPTEPMMQNFVNIVSSSKNTKLVGKGLLDYQKKSKEKIAAEGSRLIANDMNVFSHCHSSTVIEILKYAKKKRKKKFTVYTVEVEPLLQGRKTAEDLAKEGIKVFVFPDLAVETALKKCDIFFFGADAFTKKGIVNKIGTSTLCEIAKAHKIPRYSCGNSLKITKKVKLEKRKGSEVWRERNKNISVENPAFDFTNYKKVSGIVSELGILHPKEFVKKAKVNLKRLSHL
jgi:translation initiation factor 2B subunit (eIF-2B alpha/beta/delta family)